MVGHTVLFGLVFQFLLEWFSPAEVEIHDAIVILSCSCPSEPPQSMLASLKNASVITAMVTLMVGAMVLCPSLLISVHRSLGFQWDNMVFEQKMFDMNRQLAEQKLKLSALNEWITQQLEIQLAEKNLKATVANNNDQAATISDQAATPVDIGSSASDNTYTNAITPYATCHDATSTTIPHAPREYHLDVGALILKLEKLAHQQQVSMSSVGEVTATATTTSLASSTSNANAPTYHPSTIDSRTKPSKSTKVTRVLSRLISCRKTPKK